MQPKLFLAFLLLIAAYCLSLTTASCSSKGKATFCDTACTTNDSIKYTDNNHSLKPYVWVSRKDCMADAITLGYLGSGVNRKFEFGKKINEKYMKCYIKDTSYAWLIFNTCEYGRGYAWKLPFNKSGRINKANS